jgi:anion-transporting  ArsA/GET3 family ATPase
MAQLPRTRLLVITGKGGVGKSTVATALALALTQSGRRTLLCEVNAGGRAAELLGHTASGPEVKRLEGELWSVDVRPAEAMREYVLKRIRIERVYRAVFENPLVRAFLRFIPSLAETVMLGKILWHLREADGTRPRWDVLVVDAPGTGHALSFLGVPQALLDTLPPSTMADEARWMRDLLVDPVLTKALVVCLPEELPILETVELVAGLRALHLALMAVVLNQATAERFLQEELTALAASPGLEALARAHAEQAELSRQTVERLGALQAPVLSLPRLYHGSMDRAGIEALGAMLLAGFERWA